MLCYALAAIIWGLERWQAAVGRWFITIALSILVNLSFIRFGVLGLYPLLILLPLLALALMTWTAAITTALLDNHRAAISVVNHHCNRDRPHRHCADNRRDLGDTRPAVGHHPSPGSAQPMVIRALSTSAAAIR